MTPTEQANNQDIHALQAINLQSVDLAQLHGVQLEMLLEFDRVCRTLNLRYQLAAGTLLGAVRHSGFIAWDDDVDVAMPRPDYERLLAVGSNVLQSKYFLQHRRSDPAISILFTKLRRNDSEFREQGRQHASGHHGIYLDIFPFDIVKPDTLVGRAHLAAVRGLRLLEGLLARDRAQQRRGWQFGQISAKRPLMQRLLARGICSMANVVPVRYRLALQARLLMCFKHHEPTHVVCLAQLPIDHAKATQLIRPASEFFELTELVFEGHRLPAPKHYEQTLTRLYGDWRQLPPQNQRRPTHPIVAFRLPKS